MEIKTCGFCGLKIWCSQTPGAGCWRSLEKQLVIYAVSLKHRPGIDPGKLKIPKQTIIMRSSYQCEYSSITHLLAPHDYVIQFCKGPCLSRQILATTRQILPQFHKCITMVFIAWFQQTRERTSLICRWSQRILAHPQIWPKMPHKKCVVFEWCVAWIDLDQCCR